MPLRRAARALAAAACALAALTAAPAAEAYPQFQLSTGNTRCSNCHLAPDGGGLINDYGRYEAEATISRGGDGAFLHGLVDEPDWLRTGADLRVAATGRPTRTEPSYAAFPMQGDVYGWFRAGDFSAALTLGVRAQVRESDSPVSRIVSDEHYVMWQPEQTGVYARAGRFMPTYGLRLPDHTSYVRRFTGLHQFEEKYTLGGGFVEDDWEVHANAYVPAPLVSLDFGKPEVVGRDASGGAFYYENRILDGTGAFGVQAKVDTTDADTQYWGGGIGKYYLDAANLLVLGQLDVGRQSFDFDPGPSRNQLAGYLGLTTFPIQGVSVGTSVQRYDEDLDVDGTARDAVQLQVQYFFRAHWELMLMGKLEAQGGDYGDPSALGLAMLHYYL